MAEDSGISISDHAEDINTLFWFRKSLRIHDNPALKECVRGATTLRCVYFLDPWFACSQTHANSDVHKWKFLLESLEDLDQSLRKLNSRLFVVRGQPTEALPRLFKEWGINRIGFEYDSEPFGKLRDNAIKRLAESSDIEVVMKVSHTLYNPEEIINLNNGIVPQTYKRFQELLSAMMLPDTPVSALTLQDMANCITPITQKQEETYRVPKLEELGFNLFRTKSSFWKGGEKKALVRLQHHVEKRFQLTNTIKKLDETLLPDKSILGPYLRFGCLSIRLLYHRLRDVYIKCKGHPPTSSFYGQILWREFLYTASTNNPNFDRMNGNPISLQVPWTPNPRKQRLFEKGRTGYPWIDAIIAQLRQEGWIHPIARHALASFMTWGNLWISWEEGCKFFEDLLLDVDWTLSAGFWSWSSSLSCLQKFSKTFCPVEFGKKLDPSGNYIRRYLPVLKNMPEEYLFETWKAPLDVQKSFGCIIGVDYPKPIIDYQTSSKINRNKLRMLSQPRDRNTLEKNDSVHSSRPHKKPMVENRRPPLSRKSTADSSKEEIQVARGKKRTHDEVDTACMQNCSTTDNKPGTGSLASTKGTRPHSQILHNIINIFPNDVFPITSHPLVFLGSTPPQTTNATYLHISDIHSQQPTLGNLICSAPPTATLYSAPASTESNEYEKFAHPCQNHPVMSVLPSNMCVSLLNSTASDLNQGNYVYPAYNFAAVPNMHAQNS